MNRCEIWPPTYKIKLHKNAKRITLKISPINGLEVTLPPHLKQGNISYILEENKNWITQQLFKIRLINHDLPNIISFHSIKEQWKINYINSISKLQIIMQPNYEITLMGDLQDKIKCKKILINWVKEKSGSYLENQLSLLSKITNLFYKTLIIRQQRSLWGSCSNEKKISLNFKLIFLPTHLIHHVMMHELCHTEHLNHSSKFWNLLEKHDPDFKKHKKELKHAGQFIPDWVSF